MKALLGREWAVYAICALFAAVVTQTGLPTHRVWAWWALPAYAVAAVVARWGRPRGLVLAVTTFSLVAPLVHMAFTGLEQNEVTVVFTAAERLLAGDPLYPHGEALGESVARIGVDAYFPYLPGMAFLGVPAVLADGVGLGPVAADPRVVFAAVYLVAVACLLRDGVDRARWWLVLVASPVAALPLACGGVDLPVVGALLVALALSRADRPLAAGLALGLACAAKLTAWPVAVVLVVVRRSPRMAAGVGAVLAPALVPAGPGLVVHNVGFPAGLAPVASPAASPFPGHLVAEHVPGGRVLALVLLVVAALCFAAALWCRPPTSEAGAAVLCAAGLTAATLLMPATRVGYLVYPIALLVAARVLRETEPVEREGRIDAPTPG